MHAATHVEVHLHFEEGGVLGPVVVLQRKWYWCGDNVSAAIASADDQRCFHMPCFSGLPAAWTGNQEPPLPCLAADNPSLLLPGFIDVVLPLEGINPYLLGLFQLLFC
jgi:hypothetical protein